MFLIAFLIPMVLRASVLDRPVPGTPRLLTKLHDIACLFPSKPSGWSSYYVQVLYPGHTQWTTLDQSELFGLRPFGRRTRMHRYLVDWGAKPGRRTTDMARWILVRWITLHDGEVEPVAIRFTLAWTIPDREHPPAHGWEQPEWIRVPIKQQRIIASYTREELLEP